MNNNKLLGIIVWALGLVLGHVFLFVLSAVPTGAVIVTCVFTWLAFISQLVLWLVVWNKPLSHSAQFYQTPIFLLSGVYLLGQLMLCLIFALVKASVRAALLTNIIWMLLLVALLALTMISRNFSQRVDVRQKNHHKEL